MGNLTIVIDQFKFKALNCGLDSLMVSSNGKDAGVSSYF